MKYIKPLWMAVAGFMAVSCADDYKATIPVPDKPYDVAMDQRLSAYSVLTDYVSDPEFRLGVNVDPADYTKHGLTYSIVHTNFNQIETASQFLPSMLINEEGDYDFSGLSSIAEAAGKDGVSLFGPALCSLTNIPDSYLKGLIAPTIIPYEPWSEQVKVADFENEAAGTKYPSSKKNAGSVNVAIADDPAGVQGKVLGCTKLTMDLPKVPKVTLPAGYTLADVSRVRLKCYIVDGKATSSRLQIETAGYNEKDNDYKTTGEWLDYVFDMSKIKLTAQQMALNSFSLCAGAYGSNISCYIDDVQVQIDHLKGDDTVIEKSDAEKKEIIGGQLDKWVNGVLEVCGGNVSEYIIYDEPLDDESASFDWAAYLGDGYVADVQKAVNDAVGMPVRYFVSQTLSLGENTPADIDEIMKSVAALEAKGVKVDGINLVLDAVYRQEYSAQVKNEAAVEKAMAHLSKIDRPVRISNFTVKVLDHSGMQVSPSSLNTVERQAVAELYEKVVRGYMDGAGANAYGFSFSDVVDGSVNVAPWAAGGNRNFVYEGIVRGLDRK